MGQIVAASPRNSLRERCSNLIKGRVRDECVDEVDRIHQAGVQQPIAYCRSRLGDEAVLYS